MTRRLRIWYSPSGETPAGLPVEHRTVVFGAVSIRGADVLVDPTSVPVDRSGLLVITRGDKVQPDGDHVVVQIPRGLLERMPDPAVIIADLIAAHLIT